jgi:spermidine synthase
VSAVPSVPPGSILSAASRLAIHAAVFGSGAILMALEILGSRILAPAHGSSIFVWGSLIAVFLAALASGAWLGGLLADARPSLILLGIILVTASIMVWAIPFLAPAVVRVAGGDVRLGSLGAAFGLFFLPTALLGSVPTFSIRLHGTRPTRLGSTAGWFYALSTAGSMAGTLGTAFLLIPLVGVADLLRWLAAGLALLGALAMLAGRSWHTGPIAALAVVLSLSASPPAAAGIVTTGPPNYRTLGVHDSLYHHLRVLEDERARYLYFGCCAQGGVVLADPLESAYDYVDYFFLGMALRPEAREILAIGLGPGIVPRHVLANYPQAHFDVVEIDPDVVRLARDSFFFADDPKIVVHVEDGRRFLDGSSRRYDVIMVDAFTADGIAFHLTTRELLTLVREHLKPEGLLVVNLSGVRNGPRQGFLPSYYRTVADVFPERYAFADTYSDETDPDLYRNVFIVAGKGQQQTLESLSAAVRTTPASSTRRDPSLLVSNLRAVDPGVSNAILLRDDYAPVETLVR